jgi:hypothetical protein
VAVGTTVKTRRERAHMKFAHILERLRADL